MRKIAYNNNAVLIKTDNKEYWYIVAGFNNHGCFNNQSLTYNASNALKAFEESFGSALWVNPKIKEL